LALPPPINAVKAKCLTAIAETNPDKKGRGENGLAKLPRQLFWDFPRQDVGAEGVLLNEVRGQKAHSTSHQSVSQNEQVKHQTREEKERAIKAGDLSSEAAPNLTLAIRQNTMRGFGTFRLLEKGKETSLFSCIGQEFGGTGRPRGE